jgi:hypothetical protein
MNALSVRIMGNPAPDCGQPGLFTRLVYTTSFELLIVIELTAIISHITYYYRLAKTFRIQREMTVVHVLDHGMSGKEYEFN